MPTYEYTCAKCGHEFEVFQSMKDDALEICPRDKCARARWGKGKVKRRVGAGAGLIFKGSGFYTTDYRSESYKAGAKSDTGGSFIPTPAATPSTSTPPSSGAGTSKSDSGGSASKSPPASTGKTKPKSA